jgi:phosphatidylcholine synthase
MRTKSLLYYCAWAVHLYTAIGAVTSIIALDRIARGDFHGALIVMAIALFVDSTDGPLARSLKIGTQLPFFDGSLLDNIVDYLNYVAVPVFFMLRAGIMSEDLIGLTISSFIMVASAYAFCRSDAKTSDHYFRGFPSYWNIVGFYLFCLQWPQLANYVVLCLLALMEFLPIKFIYPNRTQPLRGLTLTLGLLWAVVTVLMLPAAPSYNPLLLSASLAFVVYYFAMSFALYFRPRWFCPAQNLTGTQRNP